MITENKIIIMDFGVCDNEHRVDFSTDFKRFNFLASIYFCDGHDPSIQLTGDKGDGRVAFATSVSKLITTLGIE